MLDSTLHTKHENQIHVQKNLEYFSFRNSYETCTTFGFWLQKIIIESKIRTRKTTPYNLIHKQRSLFALFVETGEF